MKNSESWNFSLRGMIIPLIVIMVFYSVAFIIWRSTGKIFFLFNFVYIGTSIGLGMALTNALPRRHMTWGRRIAQFLVGCYLLFFVGFGLRENMQFEGFVLYLVMGLFAGAVVHYLVAKLFGPMIFGRGWCGWACWTAGILDLLPWKKPKEGRLTKWGVTRYVHAALATAAIFVPIYLLGIPPEELRPAVDVIWYVVGNVLYFISALVLAVWLQDNRAFCKYLCPIPVLQKAGCRFALLKVAIDDEVCIECGKCEKSCPMNILLLDYKNTGTRVLSTECILCTTCVKTCPTQAVKVTTGFDIGGKECLGYHGDKPRTHKRQDVVNI